MKKAKRLVSFVAATAMMFSVVAPGMAATVDDAYGRLNALGVAKGYTDGTIGADKQITRAEFAAVAVRLLGMEAAVNSAKGATKFKDVASSHWASGYINLAVGNGIIKGYPNGTFAPEANVTYAEASAMLVRVLGYEPQIAGVWPTNYIGKAAQLGLLDGVSTNDFNSPAIRGNVFLAADNSLDVLVLKSTKDGYEEDTKTLMEKKLSVTKLAEATVTDVPNVNLNLAKNEVTLDAGVGTMKLVDSLDPNPYLGQKVQAWEKDDKIFFMDVKTSASDIVVDKIDTFTDTLAGGTINADDTILMDASDKTYTLGTGVKAYKNFVVTTTPTDLANGNEVKIILDGGKAKYIIANSYTTRMVEKVNTTDEKLTFEVSGSLTLKDKVATIVKDGKAVTLADIKPGDVVDYIDNTVGTDGAVYIVVTSGKTVEGKLTGAATDGTKVTIDGKEYKTNDDVKLSTNDGDTYGSAGLNDGSDYSSHFNKTVKGFLNKNGKIAFMIAGDSATASAYTTAVVKDIKRTTGGVTEATYIFVAKFDGTETYYEVTKDSKVDGTKVVEDSLKLPERTAEIKNADTVVDQIVRGQIVKLTLTTDGKVDNIVPYTDDQLNLAGIAPGYATNKTSDTVTFNGVAYKVDANTKILKVKTYKDANATNDVVAGVNQLTYLQDGQIDPVGYIDDVDTVTWAAAENLGTVAGGHIDIVKDAGVAKYVVIFDTDAPTTSTYKYGMVITTGDNADGTYWNMKVDGADFSKQFDNGAALVKGDLAKFKLNSTDEIDSAATVTAFAETVSGNAYNNFKVVSVDTANKRIEVIAVTNSTGDVTFGSNFYVDVNDTTKYFDAEDTSAISVLAIDAINSDDIIKLYDAFDKDGDDQAAGAAFDSTELVYDFVVRVNK